MALIKEPLVHFLFIGAVLFAAFGLQQEESSDEVTNRILVNAGQIDQLFARFEPARLRTTHQFRVK